MTLVLGKFMDKLPDAPDEKKEAKEIETVQETAGEEAKEVPEEEVFYAHAKGQLIPMEEVKDETFASGVLGDGVAVIPEEGKVYAPADGTILSVFDTKHAVCFASSHGTEVLVHIGVDTVNLQGRFFTAHVKDGDAVEKGQLLIEFDKEQIEKAGYDTAIPMIFTDMPEGKVIEKTAPGAIDSGMVAGILKKV